MNQDYRDLRSLLNHVGFQKLQAIMVHQVSDIEKARDRAAQRGMESSWRYWAGQEKGFKLAMTALDRALADIEQKETDLNEDSEVSRMMSELKLKGDAV